MDLLYIQRLITNKTGLFFEDERLSTLTSAIDKRMQTIDAAQTLKDYIQIIESNPFEFNELINLLTINETYFFRESQHLKILTDTIIPELLQKKPLIKIMSAGCSGGQEPYSIVISLLEKYGSGFRRFCSVIGADIDSSALKKASIGKYYGESFRNFDNAFKIKYFDETKDGGYQLKDFVKDAVVFQVLNLQSPTYPDNLKEIDIIFYRNVSIYFKQDTKKEIFEKLSQILNNNGYLILSSTETFCHNTGILSLKEIDGLFVYYKGIDIPIVDRRKPKTQLLAVADLFPKRALDHVSHSGRTQSFPPAKADRRTPKTDLFDEALAFAIDKKYNDALKAIDTLIDSNPSFYKGYALKTSILINLNRLKEAKDTALSVINKDTLNIEAYLLLGIIARIEQDDFNTIKRLKEALYLKPNNWLAHFYLADAHLHNGEKIEASKEYKIVLKLLELGNITDHGLTMFPMSVSIEQLQRLCRSNLSKLNNL
jgi:chemotaxis protein methyltransferase CheR